MTADPRALASPVAWQRGRRASQGTAASRACWAPRASPARREPPASPARPVSKLPVAAQEVPAASPRLQGPAFPEAAAWEGRQADSALGAVVEPGMVRTRAQPFRGPRHPLPRRVDASRTPGHSHAARSWQLLCTTTYPAPWNPRGRPSVKPRVPTPGVMPDQVGGSTTTSGLPRAGSRR